MRFTSKLYILETFEHLPCFDSKWWNMHYKTSFSQRVWGNFFLKFWRKSSYQCQIRCSSLRPLCAPFFEQSRKCWRGTEIWPLWGGARTGVDFRIILQLRERLNYWYKHLRQVLTFGQALHTLMNIPLILIRIGQNVMCYFQDSRKQFHEVQTKTNCVYFGSLTSVLN